MKTAIVRKARKHLSHCFSGLVFLHVSISPDDLEMTKIYSTVNPLARKLPITTSTYLRAFTKVPLLEKTIQYSRPFSGVLDWRNCPTFSSVGTASLVPLLRSIKTGVNFLSLNTLALFSSITR